MDTSKKHILQYLDSRHIPYDMVVHDPVYTMEEGATLNLPHKQQIAKNLFLCDDKRAHYYMVVLEQNRQLDLKQLRTRLASRRLTFAPEHDLQDMLCLQKGSVTPFGVVYFQGIERRSASIFVTVLRQVILLVPLAWLLRFLGLGYVWLTFPITEVIATACCIVLYHIKPLHLPKCVSCST